MRSPDKPPSPVLVIASDLLAQRAKRLLDQLACGTWQAGADLRAALDAYYAVRENGIVTDAINSSDEAAPETMRGAS